MIEKYIERSVLRQVKLVEYLCDLEKISLREVSKRIGASSITVTQDFNTIHNKLKDSIIHFKIENGFLSLKFDKKINIYNIIQKLYRESDFLKICSSCLLGEDKVGDLAHKYHFSYSKAFKIKKKVETYFEEVDIAGNDDIEKFYSIDYRDVFLSVFVRFGIPERLKKNDKFKLAEKFYDNFILRVGLSRNKRQEVYMQLCAYMSICSIENGYYFNFEHKHIFEECFISQEIIKSLESLNLNGEINQYEVGFLTLIGVGFPLNLKNYEFINVQYEYIKKEIYSHFPKILKLKTTLFSKLNISTNLLSDQIFEEPFLKFCCAANIGLSMFIIDRHIWLNDEQKKIADIIYQVINSEEFREDFKVKHIPSVIVERLAALIYSSTILNGKKIMILIVAKNASGHIIFREALRKWINEEICFINNTNYYSVDEIPQYIDWGPTAILCERAIFPEDKKFGDKIYSISFSTIKYDIKKFMMSIYDKVFYEDKEDNIVQ